MRNKTLLAIAVAGMMCGTSVFAAPSNNFGSGQVTFRGTITNAPCDIKPGDDKLDVDFGQVSYKALKNADATDETDVKQFTIHLQNCEFEAASSTDKATNPGGLMSKVQIAFSGTPASGSKNAFVSGSDASLGVQLTGPDGQVITPKSAPDFTDATAHVIQLGPDASTLNYTAKLMNVGTASSVKTGAFSIPVNYTLKYQ